MDNNFSQDEVKTKKKQNTKKLFKKTATDYQ